jgi:hypothetical protein
MCKEPVAPCEEPCKATSRAELLSETVSRRPSDSSDSGSRTA